MGGFFVFAVGSPFHERFSNGNFDFPIVTCTSTFYASMATDFRQLYFAEFTIFTLIRFISRFSVEFLPYTFLINSLFSLLNRHVYKTS